MIISINRAFQTARNFSDPLKVMLGELKGWKADENGRSSKVRKVVGLSIWMMIRWSYYLPVKSNHGENLGKLIEHDHGEDRW